MGKILLLCLAALSCVGIGVALQCLKCDFTVFKIPCYTTTVACQDGQLCATIWGHAAGHQMIMKKNCVDQLKCNNNDTSSWACVTYVTSYSCCEGDLCNSAPGARAQLSLAMGLAVLGAWLGRGL